MEKMRASSAAAIQFPKLSTLPRGVFPITTRTRIYFPQRLLFFEVKSVGSRADVVHSFRVVPTAKLTAEKEAAKACLTLFLKEQGLSNTVAARTISKSDYFIEHLASKLHIRTQHLVGSELTTLEIRGALMPYLESLLDEHGDILVDMMESFPNTYPPKKDRPIPEASAANLHLSEKLKAMSNIENLAMDKRQLDMVISQSPAVLRHSSQNVKKTVDYLYELGFSGVSIGKILTRCPQIIGCCVANKICPTVEYFRSMGVDVSVLFYRSPHTFCLSLARNLMPKTSFFLEKGYNIDDVGTMVSRFGSLYTLSLEKNLVPKWKFFLTMVYPRSDLVMYPQYFGFNLEWRIKPRYAQVKESGVKLPLIQVLSSSDYDFEKNLKRRIKKTFNAKGSMSVKSDDGLGFDLIELELATDTPQD